MHRSTLNIISRIVLMICFSLFSQLDFSQIPQIEWQRSYGGPAGDYAKEIQITKDGGFIVTGYTEAEGGDVEGYHGNPLVSDIWILKLDASGNIQWKRTLGGDYLETSFSSIRQTPDGGYILAGTSASDNCEITGNHGGTDIWVVRLTGAGDIVWNKSFGGSKTEYASSVAITPDGGFVIAGTSESNDGDLTKNNGDRDAWIIKISDSGNLIWQQNFGGSETEEFLSVDILEDGSYVAAGYTFSRNGDVSFNHGEKDFFVVKIEADGSTVWIKTYGGTMHDVANGVAATSDGGCILAGSTSSNDGDVSGNHQSIGTFSDFWVVKIDKSGNIQRQYCYGGQYNEIANSIALTPDGGYLIAGSAESRDGDLNCNAGVTDCWVVKINDGGIILWQKSFGGSYYDEATSAQPLSNGSTIVAGQTCSPEINGYHNTTIQNGTCSDFWIVKLSVPTLIISKPKVEIDKSSGICNGRATLKASAKFAGTKYRFEWLRNSLPVNSISAEYTALDFKNGDVIVCKMTTGGPCEDVNITTVSDTFKIQNNPDNIQPVISLSADNTTVCNCSQITFSSSVNNGGKYPQYQWLVNDKITGDQGAIFKTKTLKEGDQVKFRYTDSLACIAAGAMESNAIVITAGGNISPAVTISSSTMPTCKGTSVQFLAMPINAGVNPTFQWKKNGNNAGTNSNVYTDSALSQQDEVQCVVTTDSGYICGPLQIAISNSIYVDIVDKVVPTITITASTDSICKGSPVTFTANFENAGDAPAFSWTVNGQPAGTNSNDFTTTVLNNGNIVNCLLHTDPAFSCAIDTTAISNKISVGVRTGVNSSLNITSSKNNICFGDTVSFYARATNVGANPQYQWKVNNQAVASGDPAFVTGKISNGDIVSCTLSPDVNSCFTGDILSNTISMTVEDLPMILINPADTFINPGTTIQFHTTVIGDISSFSWEPSTRLQNPAELSPATVPLMNDQSYKLTVGSDKGCSASKDVVVRIQYSLDMPNAFTPNSDGINDIFRIPAATALTLKEFSVYDRWGRRVFYTTDARKGWNGTVNSQESPRGAYVYIIKGSNDKGLVLKKGTVILVR